MLIFGGEKTSAFTFDTRDVSGTSKQATVKTTKAALPVRGRFGHKSDFMARTFRNVIYMIDACQNTMQVYQIKEQAWHSQSLSELGIQE